MNRKKLQDALRPLKADNPKIKLNAKTEQLQTWYDELVLGQQVLNLETEQTEELTGQYCELTCEVKTPEILIPSEIDNEPILVNDHKEQVIEVYYSPSDLYSYQINTNEKVTRWANKAEALKAAEDEIDSWFGEDNENIEECYRTVSGDAKPLLTPLESNENELSFGAVAITAVSIILDGVKCFADMANQVFKTVRKRRKKAVGFAV